MVPLCLGIILFAPSWYRANTGWFVEFMKGNNRNPHSMIIIDRSPLIPLHRSRVDVNLEKLTSVPC